MRDFYRTEMGKTLRVEENEEGAPTVAVLKEGSWAGAPLGLIGLRLSPNTRRLTAGDQEPSAMTDAATRQDGLFSPRCDTFGQTVRVASRASFPDWNGLIAFGLSPVAANEVTALPTVERRIVRRTSRDGRTRQL